MLSVKVVKLGDLAAGRRQSISETTDTRKSYQSSATTFASISFFSPPMYCSREGRWGNSSFQFYSYPVSRGNLFLFQYCFLVWRPSCKSQLKVKPEFAECFVLSWFSSSPPPPSPPPPPPPSPPPIPWVESSSWSLLGFLLREIFWQSSTCISNYWTTSFPW